MKGWWLGVNLSVAVGALMFLQGCQDGTPPRNEEEMIPSDEAGKLPSWRIKGKLSEACTCDVPCNCNFGEHPAPHDYCYAAWSYWIEEGEFEGVSLNDLHVGGVEGERGFRALLDDRGSPEQRHAMEELTYALTGRMVCLVRLWPIKASASELIGGKPGGQGSILHTSYQDREFLGFDYLRIRQEVTDREARIHFGDRGGFEARFIMGRDPSQPVTVTNNVSWPIKVSIKGKTTFLKYKDEFVELDYKGTNANQGDFEISSDEEGARPMMRQ